MALAQASGELFLLQVHDAHEIGQLIPGCGESVSSA